MIAMFLRFSMLGTNTHYDAEFFRRPLESASWATMRGMQLSLMVTSPILLLLGQSPESEPSCPPCGGNDHAGVTAVRQALQEAFTLSMTVPDCSGVENFETCRTIEGLVEEAFESLDAVVAEGEAGGSIDCVSCNPRPHLSPLFSSLELVAEALVERGYSELAGKKARMEQEIQLWKGYSCCGQSASRATPTRNRERDARAMLNEKCGVNFQKNRQGLRQVVRIPGDRQGCFQSRACRDATQRNGQFIEAGFWTYDGEYWYVWEQRLTPRGEWVECNP